ncbi:uroporphyrinogen-III synthase [Devosia sp.]|uniref:uroporphyrinogen-III synthase n=1 Tax=Devosia sp. TaxID=1871048 RepID=UPI0035B24A21
MLVTRPDPDASDTAARLGALGIEGVACPLLVHETLGGSIPDPEGFAAIALTSSNALRALVDRGQLARYRGLPVFTVGDRTAEAARRHGFARVESARGGFADLVDKLAHTTVGGPILYFSARDLAGDLAKSLAPHGRMVITAQIYAMNPVAAIPDAVLAALGDGEIGAVLFYSRRTAATFVRLTEARLGRAVRQRLGVLCLSETVAEPLVDAHFVRIGLADHPSEEAMMSLALSFYRDQNAS